MSRGRGRDIQISSKKLSAESLQLTGPKGFLDDGYRTGSGFKVGEILEDLEEAIICGDAPHALFTAVDIYRLLINTLNDGTGARHYKTKLSEMYGLLARTACQYITPHNINLISYTCWFYLHEVKVSYQDGHYSLPWLLAVVELLTYSSKSNLVTEMADLDNFDDLDDLDIGDDDTRHRWNDSYHSKEDRKIIRVTNKIHQLITSKDQEKRKKVFPYLHYFLDLTGGNIGGKVIGCKKGASSYKRDDMPIWTILEEVIDCDVLQPLINYYSKIGRKSSGTGKNKVTNVDDNGIKVLLAAYAAAVYRTDLKSKTYQRQRDKEYRGIDQLINSWESNPLLTNFRNGKYKYHLYDKISNSIPEDHLDPEIN